MEDPEASRPRNTEVQVYSSQLESRPYKSVGLVTITPSSVLYLTGGKTYVDDRAM